MEEMPGGVSLSSPTQAPRSRVLVPGPWVGLGTQPELWGGAAGKRDSVWDPSVESSVLD